MYQDVTFYGQTIFHSVDVPQFLKSTDQSVHIWVVSAFWLLLIMPLATFVCPFSMCLSVNVCNSGACGPGHNLCHLSSAECTCPVASSALVAVRATHSCHVCCHGNRCSHQLDQCLPLAQKEMPALGGLVRTTCFLHQAREPGVKGPLGRECPEGSGRPLTGGAPRDLMSAVAMVGHSAQVVVGLLCPQPCHAALFLSQPSLCPWLGRPVASRRGSQALLGCWGPPPYTVFPPARPFPFTAT